MALMPMRHSATRSARVDAMTWAVISNAGVWSIHHLVRVHPSQHALHMPLVTPGACYNTWH